MGIEWMVIGLREWKNEWKISEFNEIMMMNEWILNKWMDEDCVEIEWMDDWMDIDEMDGGWSM